VSAVPQLHTEWKVLPHGKLTPVDEDIRTVTGDIPMPVGNLERRMTVVRLRDGRLVVYSPMALDDDEMQALEDFGTPAFLIIPNSHHRLDAKPWKDRYPAAQVIAPQGARDEVEKAVPVDATRADFGDPEVALVPVPGTGAREAALEVRKPAGTTLVLNDIVGNIRHAPGFGGWLLRLMGFAGDKPHVPVPVKMMMVDDKKALAAQLEQWAALPELKRIIVSHGATVEDDPRGTLRALAASLQ
jgi:hypothetical protein